MSQTTLEKSIYSLEMQEVTVASIQEAINTYTDRKLMDKSIQFIHLAVEDINQPLTSKYPVINLKDIITNDKLQLFTPTAIRQFMTAIRMPRGAYIDAENSLCAELYADVLDYRLSRTKGSMKYRMIQKPGETEWLIRAIVSNNYGIFNHQELLSQLQPLTEQLDIESLSMRVNINEMSLALDSPFEFDVNPSMNDPITFSLYSHNNEDGEGGVAYGNKIWRKVCQNGLIRIFDETNVRHIGQDVALRVNEELTYARKHSQLVPIAIRNAARSTINLPPVKLEKQIALIAKQSALPDEIAKEIWFHWKANNDTPFNSLWRLINAITFTAKNATTTTIKNDLEILGGKILYNSGKYGLPITEISETTHTSQIPLPINQQDLIHLGLNPNDWIKELQEEEGKVFTDLGINPQLIRNLAVIQPITPKTDTYNRERKYQRFS